MLKYFHSAKAILLGARSIIPLIFCSLLLGITYVGVKSQSERAIHATVAATNEALATNIYEQYRDTITQVIRNHNKREPNSYVFDQEAAPVAENIQLKFDMMLHKIILSTSVFDLHIFAPDGHLVWDSGDSSHPGEPHEDNDLLKQAVAGIPATQIKRQDARHWHILHKSEQRLTAVSYIPLFDIRYRQIGVLEIYSHVDDATVAAVAGVRNIASIVLTAFLLCLALTLVTLVRSGPASKARRLAAPNTADSSKTDSRVALVFGLGGGTGLGALLGVVLLAAE